MAKTTRGQPALTRRQLILRSGASLALAGLGGLARPSISRAADRPVIASGIQSGVSEGGYGRTLW